MLEYDVVEDLGRQVVKIKKILAPLFLWNLEEKK